MADIRESDLRSRSRTKQTADLLSQVEMELRHADAADDQIGEHAATMEDKLRDELQRRQGHGATATDPKAGAEYLRLLRMRHHARLVGGVAHEEKRRRGG